MRLWSLCAFSAAFLVAPVAVAQNAFFAGLQHQALGQSSLTIVGSSLVVGNNGSSGLDGVQVDLGASRGQRTAWDPIDPGGTLPSTAELAFEHFGALAAAPGNVVQLARIRVDNAPGGHVVTPDFSFVGSSTSTIDVLGGDVAIVKVTGHVGPVTVSAWPDRFGVRAAYPGQSIPCVTFGWKNPITIDIPGAGSYPGTELLIAAEGASPVASVDRSRVFAKNIPSFRLRTEEPQIFELFHRALGSAAFNLQAGALVFSNLGVTGNDGYAADLSAVERGTSIGVAPGIAASWLPLDAGGPLPSGAVFSVAALLALSGIPASAEPRLSLTQAGAAPPLDVVFNVASLQVTTYLVEVHQNGALVTRETNLSVNGTVSDWPTGMRIFATEPPFDFITYTLLFDQPVTFSLPGVGTWVGDELRFGAEDTANICEGLFDSRLRGAMLPFVQVTGENPVPPLPPFTYCTGKVNSCGGTPAISSFGHSQAGAPSGFSLVGAGARMSKAGLVMYTNNGPRVPAAPFNGGVLCIASPVRRAQSVFSVGGTPGQCDAQFVFDMNAFASGLAGGNPQAFLSVPGTQVDTQWWGRDTVANGSYLSDALQYVVLP